MKAAYAPVNGIKLWYATFPTHTKKVQSTPLFFFHGGLANSDYWGLQVDEFRWDYNVYVVDSRAQGRSGGGNGSLSYRKMAEDFVALLNYLKINKASVIGWSDGAITALDLLLNHPDRLDRVFAFAQNFEIAGVKDISTSPVFTEYISRALNEFEKIAPADANNSTKELETVTTMWATQPAYTETELRAIDSSIGRRTWIVDADRDEAVQRNQSDLAAQWIPAAGQLLIPQTSHFAFIQAPELFSSLLWGWLKDDPCA
jgi:pimeloyl-ACP methyl ester carboxylesterase